VYIEKVETGEVLTTDARLKDQSQMVDKEQFNATPLLLFDENKFENCGLNCG
jgi:hypothetical protein